MKTYSPGNVTDPELRREVTSIARAAQRADPFVLLQVLHAAPERIAAGMMVLADGTDFDPGDGAGFYQRNEANTAWVRLATLTEATDLAHNYSRRFLLMGA